MDMIYFCQILSFCAIMEHPQNIIFLDVDGVLNTVSCHEKAPSGVTGIMQSRVEILRQIADENDAEIVLTSTWGKNWYSDNISDPDVSYLVDKLYQGDVCIGDKIDEGERGASIIKWLEDHPHKGWVVLDDERFPDYKECGILPHWIQTSDRANGGLKPKHVKMAKKIFETL